MDLVTALFYYQRYPAYIHRVNLNGREVCGMHWLLLSLHMVYRVLFLTALTFMALGASAQYIPKFDVQGHRGARGLLPENTSWFFAGDRLWCNHD